VAFKACRNLTNDFDTIFSFINKWDIVEDIDLIEMRLRTLVERGFEIALNPLVVDWPLVNAIRQACPQVDQNGPMVKYLIRGSDVYVGSFHRFAFVSLNKSDIELIQSSVNEDASAFEGVLDNILTEVPRPDAAIRSQAFLTRQSLQTQLSYLIESRARHDLILEAKSRLKGATVNVSYLREWLKVSELFNRGPQWGHFYDRFAPQWGHLYGRFAALFADASKLRLDAFTEKHPTVGRFLFSLLCQSMGECE